MSDNHFYCSDAMTGKWFHLNCRKLLKFTGKCDQQVQGGDPTPLFSSSGTTSGVLCPVLGSTFQEAQGDTGEGPTEATKMRSLESALKGEIAGSGPG